MNETEMIQHLQNRFGLSKVVATVIYFTLQEHFIKEESASRKNFTKELKAL